MQPTSLAVAGDGGGNGIAAAECACCCRRYFGPFFFSFCAWELPLLLSRCCVVVGGVGCWGGNIGMGPRCPGGAPPFTAWRVEDGRVAMPYPPACSSVAHPLTHDGVGLPQAPGPQLFPSGLRALRERGRPELGHLPWVLSMGRLGRGRLVGTCQQGQFPSAACVWPSSGAPAHPRRRSE